MSTPTDTAQTKNPWWRSWWMTMPIGAALAGTVMFLIGNWIVMPLVTRGEKTLVPDLYQEDVAVAKRVLIERNLTFVSDSSDFIWDTEVQANHVANQDPPAYTEVKRGRRVRVVLSRGPRVYPIPALKNLSATEARLRLEQQGFRLGSVSLKLRTDEDRSDPFVLDQFPDPGALYPRGQRISLTISVVPTMPDLTSLGYSEATRIVSLMGLRVGSTIYERSETLLPRSVISQSVPPGNRVRAGDLVNLVLSHL